MKLKLDFVRRDIAGETFLVPIGETAKTYSGLFALNELGAYIWDRLPDAESEEDILKAILDEYEVTREEAENDMQEFLEKLRKMGIL